MLHIKTLNNVKRLKKKKKLQICVEHLIGIELCFACGDWQHTKVSPCWGLNVIAKVRQFWIIFTVGSSYYSVLYSFIKKKEKGNRLSDGSWFLLFTQRNWLIKHEQHISS